ncbi:MAG: hypothetical protein CL808_05555 [Citromicrobium sp.]|nr:hypothetical protein [Citromicrobium sp.]
MAGFSLWFILVITTKWQWLTPLRKKVPAVVDWLAKRLIGDEVSLKSQYRGALADGFYFAAIAVVFTGTALFFASPDSGLQNYLTSFNSSLVQDMFLFGIVGFAIAHLGSRDPREDNAVARLSYLLNREDLEHPVREKIFEQIAPGFVFCETMKIELEFSTYHETINAVEMKGFQRRRFFNAIKDKPIVSKQDFTLTTDGLNLDDPDFTNGLITLISYRVGDEDTVFDNQCPIAVKEEKTVPQSVPCPMGGGFLTEFGFRVWYKIGKIYSWKNRYYTKEFILVLRNRTEHTLVFSILLADMTDPNGDAVVPGNKQLSPGESLLFCCRELHVGEHDLLSLESVSSLTPNSVASG